MKNLFRILPVLLLITAGEISFAASFSQTFIHQQNKLYESRPLGIGADIGYSWLTFQESAELRSPQKTTEGVPITLNLDWRMSSFFRSRLGLSYTTQKLGGKSNTDINGYELSGTPQFRRFSAGISGMITPLQNGLYAGASIAWANTQLSWSERDLLPAYSSTANVLIWGPIVGYEYMFSSGVSVGGSLSYMIAPQMSFPDRIGNNVIALPESREIIFSTGGRYWF